MTRAAAKPPLRRRRPPVDDRARTAKLAWPKRPRPITHDVLGRCQRWQSKCGFYRVDRYAERSGRYLALAWKQTGAGWSWDLLSPHRTFAAARERCETHAKKEPNS